MLVLREIKKARLAPGLFKRKTFFFQFTKLDSNPCKSKQKSEIFQNMEKWRRIPAAF